jgi:hypothetical protein
LSVRSPPANLLSNEPVELLAQNFSSASALEEYALSVIKKGLSYLLRIGVD